MNVLTIVTSLTSASCCSSEEIKVLMAIKSLFSSILSHNKQRNAKKCLEIRIRRNLKFLRTKGRRNLS